MTHFVDMRLLLICALLGQSPAAIALRAGDGSAKWRTPLHEGAGAIERTTVAALDDSLALRRSATMKKASRRQAAAIIGGGVLAAAAPARAAMNPFGLKARAIYVCAPC